MTTLHAMKARHGGIVTESADLRGTADVTWPEDINDWENWPLPLDVNSLRSRIGDLKPETFEAMVYSFEADDHITAAIAAMSLEALERLAEDPDELVVCAIADAPDLPESVIEKLIEAGGPDVIRSLAENPDISPHQLWEMSSTAGQTGDSHPLMCAGYILAGRKDVPADALRLFATSYAMVREAVAANPATPADLLETLSKDKAKTVRRAVLKNPSASDELKEKIRTASSKRGNQQLTVAEREEQIWKQEFDRASLDSYLADKAMGVRITSAIRGTELGLMSPSDCAKLMKKEAPGRGAGYLLRRWQETQDDAVLETLLAGRFEDQLTWIASDSSTSGGVVRRLFELNIPGAAWYFVTRDDITSDELDALSTAPSHSYPMYGEPPEPGDPYALQLGQYYTEGYVTSHPQVVVALHPLTRDDTLKKMRKSRSKYVRAALAQRPDPQALPALAKDKEVMVREAVAAQTATPHEILEVLASDSEQEVRAAVHGNPNAPDTARATAALLGI